MTSATLNWRQLPLLGSSLIEASAGTGKTYNIALLYLRLLLEGGLGVRQILVTTFTDAAAQELKARIRLRLLEAERLLVDTLDLAADTTDPQSLTAFLAACASDHGAPTLLARLRLALAEIDLAPIATIHSFCRRVLSDHPFETGVGFTLGELADEGALVRECVEDYWRQHLLGDAVNSDTLALVEGRSAALDDLADLVRVWLRAPAASIQCAPADALGIPDEWRSVSALATLQALATDTRLRRGSRRASFERIGTLVDVFAGRIALSDVDCDDLVEHLSVDKLREQENPLRPGCVSAHPLLRQIHDWLKLQARAADMRFGRFAAAAIEFVSRVLPERLRARSLTTYSRLIADVHERVTGSDDTLAERLATTWPAALIDEFQDTDAQQWAIFERLYRGRGTLILIGDPKQAIYGFRGGDIHAYLAARAQLPAARIYSIHRNFRSDAALIAALNALYAAAGAHGFAGDAIRYVAVEPGLPASSASTQEPAAALQVHLLTAAVSLGAQDGIALTACADAIARLLNDPTPRLPASGGGWRRVLPADIAVLVDSNERIRRLRDLLDRRGVPVVGAGKTSVVHSFWADDLQLLLHALLHCNDERAVRGALATRLFGVDARQLATLDQDPAAWDAQLLQFARWRRDWEQRGILAVIEALIVAQAPRLLAASDGERALTDLRHLGELLQNATSERYGPEELYAWFVELRQAGDADGDAARDRQLRIESESARVQIMTVHASKGLEFGIVFAPMAWRRRDANASRSNRALYHDAARGLCLDLGSAELDAHKTIERREDLEERMRKLYVTLTRARHQCHVYAIDQLNASSDGPDAGSGELHVLLGAALARLECVGEQRWQTLQQQLPQLRIERGSDATPEPYQPNLAAPPHRIARTPLPTLRPYRGWYSFSALTRRASAADPLAAAPGAGDEGPPAVPLLPLVTVDIPAHPALLALANVRGPRFGDAVHQVFELRRFDRSATDPRQVEDALRAQGLSFAEPQATTIYSDIARLIDRTLRAPLAGPTLPHPDPAATAASTSRPEPPLILADLPANALRAEFEFAFALGTAQWGRMQALLTDHGLGDWWPGSDTQILRGLMQGYMDLVFAWDGRFHVLDYKTNWLGERTSDYQGTALDAAMGAHYYGLQALIYTVALHRYLARRIDAYDAAKHLGDSWYLFVRAVGLDGASGIWRRRFPLSLIAALDALFDGTEVHP